MFAIAARRAAPRLASKQQKRGIVDYLTNYPDKVRIMMIGGMCGAHGMSATNRWETIRRYLLLACTVKTLCGEPRRRNNGAAVTFNLVWRMPSVDGDTPNSTRFVH